MEVVSINSTHRLRTDTDDGARVEGHFGWGMQRSTGDSYREGFFHVEGLRGIPGMHFHSSTTIQSPQQAGTHLNKKTADFQKEPTPLAMAGDFRTV